MEKKLFLKSWRANGRRLKMGYASTSFQDIRSRFRDLRQAPHGGGRAPHKPLLILLMLGRYQRGDQNAARYEEIRNALADLIREFGPPTMGKPNTEDPFWRLQNDRGAVWIVRDSVGQRVSEETSPPPISRLLDSQASGNFSPDICKAFEEHPQYISMLAADLLAAHFPPSLHEDICAAVGLTLQAGSNAESSGEDVLPRDPGFRIRVLRAYEYRCAITGLDLRIGHASAALEAAHIMWHIAGGPSVESNGLALNALHHKLFDLGAFTLSLDDEVPLILVSQDCHGGDAVKSFLLDYHRKPIRMPQDCEWLPRRDFIHWHHEQVFKGSARR